MKIWPCALLLVTTTSVYCQPVPPNNTPVSVEPSQYSVEFWTTVDGLPVNFTKSIYQTSDGYMWAASFHGLARYNSKAS